MGSRRRRKRRNEREKDWDKIIIIIEKPKRASSSDIESFSSIHYYFTTTTVYYQCKLLAQDAKCLQFEPLSFLPSEITFQDFKFHFFFFIFVDFFFLAWKIIALKQSKSLEIKPVKSKALRKKKTERINLQTTSDITNTHTHSQLYPPNFISKRESKQFAFALNRANMSHLTSSCLFLYLFTIYLYLATNTKIVLSSYRPTTIANPTIMSARPPLPALLLNTNNNHQNNNNNKEDDETNSKLAASKHNLASANRTGQQREHMHYKTTFACENNQIELTCQEGKLIHLARANYGRFSVNICNDLGHSNLSVQCASFRAFLIMETR